MKNVKTLIAASAAMAAAVAFTTPASADEYSQEHKDWCLQMHPSYNAADNTYDAGPSRQKQCSSPFDDNDVVTVDRPTFDASMQLSDDEMTTHREWCMRTHKSYNAATNMYDAGPSRKKVCSSPYN